MAKILIVDDEPYIRRFLSTLLSHKGYDVVLAEDGQKGFDSVLQERLHVIVLDLLMPGMDGLTVLRQVRSLNPVQPVIILTGGTTEETEQQVRALGVKELVEKESAVHLLDAALKRVLVPDLYQRLSNS
jgi:DNA-binding response OmpR family regulator